MIMLGRFQASECPFESIRLGRSPIAANEFELSDEDCILGDHYFPVFLYHGVPSGSPVGFTSSFIHS
jgi:hypothetical protein